MDRSPQDDMRPFACRADALRPGDQVITPARRWETVTDIVSGHGHRRSTRVATDATGPRWPWEWVNQHRLITRRLPALLQEAA